MPRIPILMLLGGLLAAQQTPRVSPTAPPEEPAPVTIRVGVEEVVAPVNVYDREGAFVNGLRPDQFRLFDNGKEQNIPEPGARWEKRGGWHGDEPGGRVDSRWRPEVGILKFVNAMTARIVQQ